MQTDLSISSGHERMLYERGHARSVCLYERVSNAWDLKLRQRANVEFEREWLRIFKGYKFHVCEVCYPYLDSVRISNWLILEERVSIKPSTSMFSFVLFCLFLWTSGSKKKLQFYWIRGTENVALSSDPLRYTSVYVLRLLATNFLIQIP